MARKKNTNPIFFHNEAGCLVGAVDAGGTLHTWETTCEDRGAVCRCEWVDGLSASAEAMPVK